MLSILSLPNELLSQIANQLTQPRHCYYLALSCRRLAAVAIPVIHKLAVQDKDGLTALQWAIYPRDGCSCVRRDVPRSYTLSYHTLPLGRGRSDEFLVRVLLAQGVDVNYYDLIRYRPQCILSLRSEPAIHVALRFKEVEILRILLQHGANANLRNQCQETALHFALKHCMPEAAVLLVEHGANVNGQDADGLTALHLAFKAGSSVISQFNIFPNSGADFPVPVPVISLFNTLLKSGADVSAPDKYGRTPLHYAAAQGKTQIIRLLIEAGADVNAVSNWSTPLYEAASNLRQAAITPLLAAGASIFSTGGYRDAVNGVLLEYDPAMKPSRQAAANVFHLLLANPLQMARYIQRQPGGGGVMCWAAQADCDNIVRLLLDGGANITAQIGNKLRIGPLQHWEATALHWAVRSGAEKVARLLLTRGADITLKANVDENTAFQWAVTYKKPAIKQLIIDKAQQDADRGVDSLVRRRDWRGRNRVGVFFHKYRVRFTR